MSLSALFPTLELPGLQVGSGTLTALFSLMACALMVPNARNTPPLALLWLAHSLARARPLFNKCYLSSEEWRLSVTSRLKANPTCCSPSRNKVYFLYRYSSHSLLLFYTLVYSSPAYLSHHHNVNSFFILDCIPGP